MKRIDKLFLQFAAFYGQVWRKQFSQDEFILFMKKEWHEALAHFSNRVVELAINVCRKIQELPPTLPQFVGICKSIQKRDSFIQPVPMAKPVFSEVGKTNLAKIKQMLGCARP